MSPALGVQAGAELVVRGVAVVDERAGIISQDTDIGEGFATTSGVHGDEGQQVVRQRVGPVFGREHGSAGLVGVQHWLGSKTLFQPCQERRELLRRLGLDGAEPPGRDLHAQEVLQQLGCTLEREVLAVQQIGGKGAYFWTEAHRRFCLGREVGDGLGTAGATEPVDHVVGDHRPYRGQVDDLAYGVAHQFRARQVGPAGAAMLWFVDDHGIGGPPLEVRPGSTGLLALAALFSPLLGPALGPFLPGPYRVRRRRFPGGRRVRFPFGFQPGNPVAERPVLGSERFVLRSGHIYFRPQCLVLGPQPLNSAERASQLLSQRGTGHAVVSSRWWALSGGSSRAPRDQPPEWLPNRDVRH